jgi:hypothetical protein
MNGNNNDVVLDNGFSTGMIMDTVSTNVESPQAVVNSAINSSAIDPSMFMPRKPKQLVRQYVKTHRNDACPCGSGKKYKNCCLSTGKYEKLIVKGTVVDENESEVA